MVEALPSVSKEIRPLTTHDMPSAAALSRDVNWPHRLEDWQWVLSLGHGLAVCSQGRLQGTAMWWRYGRQMARIGMVIVDPAAQRAGIGRHLMLELLQQFDEPTVLLNATSQGETLYRQLGFQPVGTIVQHQGTYFTGPLVLPRTGERVRPVGRNDLDCLIALDAEALGIGREAVIKALMETGEAVALDRGGETAGFAFFRRFGRGYTIGPVVAPDPEGAKVLIAHWVGSNVGMFIRIDVPATAGLCAWLDELGLVRASQVTSMVRGPVLPCGTTVSVFAVVNQALG